MSLLLCCGPARDAMLSEARGRSPADELKCHALLGLIQAANSVGEALRVKELTESGFCLLACLLQPGSLVATPEEFARDLSLSRQIVAATLGRLEISGLITQERAKKDRRVLALKVTAAGRKAFANALAQYLKSITGVMSALDSHDVATLDLACARLREAPAHAPGL